MFKFSSALAAASVFAIFPVCAPAQVVAANANDSIETVVVTASPVAGNPDRFATITGHVDREQILQSGGSNLADALQDVPGVTGSGFAAGSSRPVIRGFDANRVRVLEDGIGSFDVSDIGPDHGVPIDPLSAQSIEVVRGAATLRYGSQAIGGVVNAINNRVPTALPGQPVTGEMTGSYASAADMGQGSLLFDARSGQWALHGDGFYRTAGDYDTPLGTQANSFFRGDGFSFGSSYFFGHDDDNHVGAALVHYDAKYGIPSDTTFINMRQTKGMSRSTFDIGEGPLQDLNVDIGYANYTHEEENPDGSVNSTFQDREYDARAEQIFDAMGPFSNSALGVQIQRRNFSALGEDSSYLFPTLTKTFAGFGFTEIPVGSDIHIQMGARVEKVHVEGTPVSSPFTSRDFTPVSGAVGVLFDATDDVKLGLTASSAARAPGQTELFARGGHDGPQTFETGDPDLGIERANSLEGTLRYKTARVKVEASAWSSWFNNFIYGALTGRSCDDDGICVANDVNELKELNYTQQDAHFWGFEGKGTVALWQPEAGVLNAEMQTDFVRATLSDGNNVPRIPAYRVGGGLSWEGDRFDAGFLLMYAGKQNHAGLFDTPTPSYISFDANAAWRPFEDRQGVEIALIGHNLTNDIQRNAVSFNKDEVLMPGRDIRLVVRLATD
jgi:iron complex outermembrane receptor protein